MRKYSTRRRVCRWFSELLVASLVVAGCGSVDGEIIQASHTDLTAGWCVFIVAFESGDAVGAKDAFHGRLHEPLHTLAQDATSADRGVGARLLEAKSGVEQAFDGGALDAAVVTGLETAVGDALVVLDLEPLADCTEGGTQ